MFSLCSAFSPPYSDLQILTTVAFLDTPTLLNSWGPLDSVCSPTPCAVALKLFPAMHTHTHTEEKGNEKQTVHIKTCNKILQAQPCR